MIIELKDSAPSKSAAYWTQERFVVRITTAADQLKFFKEGDDVSTDEPIATYKVTGGVVEIDVTDFVRAYTSNTEVKFYWEDDDTVFSVTYTISGMINPEKMLIPKNDLSELGGLIIPPSRMIAGIGTNWLIYATTANWRAAWKIGSVGDTYLSIDKGLYLTSINDVTQSGYVRVRRIGHGDTICSISGQVCEERYIEVAWLTCISKSGEAAIANMKIHTFKVKGQTTSAAGEYSLLEIDNAYKTIKGREDRITFYIDELTDYDLWYYSDILTSSEVRVVAFDGKIDSDNTILEVVTSSVEVPYGERLGKLEIECKFKRYDAVGL